MKTRGRLGLVALTVALWLCWPDLTENPGVVSEQASLVSSAQAVIGLPLTPVSVAGVARRTVRRCAVGVYYC